MVVSLAGRTDAHREVDCERRRWKIQMTARTHTQQSRRRQQQTGGPSERVSECESAAGRLSSAARRATSSLSSSRGPSRRRCQLCVCVRAARKQSAWAAQRRRRQPVRPASEFLARASLAASRHSPHPKGEHRDAHSKLTQTHSSCAQVNPGWTGLDWTGSDWIGLDWTGLDWTGLDWTDRPASEPTSALNKCPVRGCLSQLDWT